MNKILIAIEKAQNNYCAYSPDLPGCVSTGKTKTEVKKNMYQAIKFHIEGLKADGIKIPKSTSIAEQVLV